MKNVDFDYVLGRLDNLSTTTVKYNTTTFVRMRDMDVTGFGSNVHTCLIIIQVRLDYCIIMFDEILKYWICEQVLCSCFAGVYTEFLLKNKGAHVEVAIQNVFLYADSIMCNALILLWKSNFFVISLQSLSDVMDMKVRKI